MEDNCGVSDGCRSVSAIRRSLPFPEHLGRMFYKPAQLGIVMPSQIFVNLPVKDLKRSITFFTQLGFTFNPQFTDEHATCMLIGENIFAMLLVEKFFKTFTPKHISDAKHSAEDASRSGQLTGI